MKHTDFKYVPLKFVFKHVCSFLKFLNKYFYFFALSVRQ